MLNILSHQRKADETLRFHLSPVRIFPSIPTVKDAGEDKGKWNIVGRSVSDATTLEISLQFFQNKEKNKTNKITLAVILS